MAYYRQKRIDIMDLMDTMDKIEKENPILHLSNPSILPSSLKSHLLINFLS